LILVTVGLQGPFDRLIRAVDEWSARRDHSEIFAQIGKAKYLPKHMRFTDFVDPSEFKDLVEKARLVIAHAGIGSIISALEAGKPIVVMPRRARFREQRNDHQIATTKYFEAQKRVIAAYEEQSLASQLDYALTLETSLRISTEASPELISTIRCFLNNGLNAIKFG
jgi:UDP-N-acetylglucosamine transferase subunit ALG13